jgi:uncharacterized protein YbjT (DUF2867 family)
MPDVEVVAADLTDKTDTARLMREVDAVFLSTGNVPSQFAQEKSVISAATQAHVLKVVKISVAGVAADAPLALARVHHAAEIDLRSSGLPHAVLRPAFFMDNFLQYTSWIDEAGDLQLPLGDGPMGMIDTRDIADVALAELTDFSSTDNDLILTGKLVGRPMAHVDGTKASFLRRYIRDGNSPEYAEDIATLYDAILRPGYGAGTTDTVPRRTGHTARTIEDFARAHGDAFRN